MGDEKQNPIRALVDAIGGKAGLRKARRKVIVVSFTRLLGHKPMAKADIGQGRAWRSAMAEWVAKCATAREGTYRRENRAAIKRDARDRWEANRDKRRARRREERAIAKALTRGAFDMVAS